MKSLRRLLPYILKYKSRLIWGFVAITLSNVFSVAIPRFIGTTIDRLDKGITTDEILTQVLIIVALSIGSGVFLFLTRQTIIVMSRMVEYDLRNDFLRHVQSLSMKYFSTTPTGDVMALATNDIPAVRNFVGPALMYSANTLTTFTFALVMMLTLSPKITLLALLPLPLVSYSVYKIGKKVHHLFGSVQKQYADLTSMAQENMSGVRIVRAYVREAFSIDAFRAMSEVYRVKNMQLVKTEALMMPAMMALIGLSQIIVLGVGGYEVIQGRSTIGDITQFFAYISQLIWPVIAIGWVTNIVQRGAASMARLNEIFDIKPDITDEAKVIEVQHKGTNGISAKPEHHIEIKGKIEFRDVTFRYRPETPVVLKNISFTVEPGETLAIIGATGSGKSSIVSLIARLYDTTEGTVLIDDKPIKSIPLEDLRGSIGSVTQETFLFSDTIAGNIRFGRIDATTEEVEEATRLAQLESNIAGFPKGYDTIVGERGITLSGGQKQRTSLARAVLREPKILILDDALSAVDTETEEHILSGLRQVMKQRTSILIAHRISTVKDADKIIVLEDGHIAERGSHEELLQHNGIYAAIHERQLLEEQLEGM